ncbi:T17B22.17 PROTEIN [Salix purpurea]|uniref:T17B22.17 PROTEIN n=1 Tax=Salix purpurea TaxID=77065 RepID=A0A9Q0V8C8_SALPP|nr:T17B22.17 PROTEIN [Salix purpurea]
MEEGSGTAADGNKGPIVWVRRRNGSWWPGQIMEADELAVHNLTSPRTGTPVKLLGRDDASVDTITMKVVLSCTSLINLPSFLDWYNLEKSKRVKAFRCAEFSDCIERAESALGMPIKKREKYARREDAILHALELEKQLMRKQGTLDIAFDCPRSKSSGSLKTELGAFSEGSINSSGKPEDVKLNQPLRGVDIEIPCIPLIPLKAKDEDQSISEVHSEAKLQMRGSRDFGRRTALKRKFSPSVDLDRSWRRPAAENKYEDPPDTIPHVEVTPHANGMEKTGAIFRAKRTRCVYLPADSSDSMDDKDIPSSQNKFFPTKDVESDLSGSNSSESESDSSQTEPDVDKEMVVFSDVALPIEAEQDALGQPKATLEHVRTSSEESDGLISSDDMDDLYHDEHFLAHEAVSKWQLKGQKEHSISYTEACQYGIWKRKYMGSKIYRLGNRGYTFPSKRHCEDMGTHSNRIFGGHNHFGGRARSMLVDVDLKVQSSYQKDRVPIVSLISKFDGKAIIGHPIPIEAVEDGLSETLFPLNDYYSNEAVDQGESTDAAAAEDIQFMDLEKRVPFRKSSGGSFGYKANLARKSLRHVPQPSANKKFPRQMPKKVSSPSNQKTRTLSSIGIKQNLVRESCTRCGRWQNGRANQT